MKKIFTMMVLAATFFCATPAKAQFEYGVRAGLDFTKINSLGDDVKTKNHAGFFLGPTVAFTFPIVGVGIDASALYEHRENKINDQKVRQNSINIPVNVRYGIGLASLVKVFAFTGPQFAFNLGKRDFDWVEPTSVSNTTSGGVSYAKENFQLKKSNLSWNIGVGATVLKHVQATVNYNIGLGKTSDYKGSIVSNDVETIYKRAKGSSNTWQVGVAYLF